jgi:hypothetical protein
MGLLGTNDEFSSDIGVEVLIFCFDISISMSLQRFNGV